ncbi:hypothetical protein VULLAG_LOCUS8256 [Vulpes lagopus]
MGHSHRAGDRQMLLRDDDVRKGCKYALTLAVGKSVKTQQNSAEYYQQKQSWQEGSGSCWGEEDIRRWHTYGCRQKGTEAPMGPRKQLKELKSLSFKCKISKSLPVSVVFLEVT